MNVRSAMENLREATHLVKEVVSDTGKGAGIKGLASRGQNERMSNDLQKAANSLDLWIAILCQVANIDYDEFVRKKRKRTSKVGKRKQKSVKES